jgi:hypothetical protein
MLAPENQCSLDEKHPVLRVGDAEEEVAEIIVKPIRCGVLRRLETAET